MERKTVKVQFLDPKAKLPEKKSEEAAAFDLYALEDTELVPFQVNKVRTGLAVEVPVGFKGEVYTRSGYGAKGIFVVNQPGKIDSDYRGELFVALLYIPQDMGKNFNLLVNAFQTFIRQGAGIGQTFQLANNIRELNLKPYEIKAGDRIAQFEIQSVEDTRMELCDELSESERGSGGFGSTGK